MSTIYLSIIQLISFIAISYFIFCTIVILNIKSQEKSLPKCPKCGFDIKRIKRTKSQKLLSKLFLFPLKRYECQYYLCKWSGFFAKSSYKQNILHTLQPNYNFSLTDKNLFLVGDTEFSRAIFKDELTLFYQPQLTIQNNTISGIETFLRWYHPIFGLISPSVFLIDSPTTRISPSISKWIFDEAFFKFSDWYRQDLLSHLSINLSPEQFYGDGLVKSITKRLDRHSLNPDLIDIEVSESTLSQNIDMAQRILRDLRDSVGIKVTIDNFGRNYSSINGLTTFSLDKVKISSSLFQEKNTDLGDKKILRSIIDLSKKINVKCIAQGVESLEQFDFLRSIGIDSVQGNFICDPVSAEVMTKLLKTDFLTSKLSTYPV